MARPRNDRDDWRPEKQIKVEEVERLGSRQRTESISLMEVAARTVLHNKWTDEEKKALPRRGDESWIGLYQEFLVSISCAITI